MKYLVAFIFLNYFQLFNCQCPNQTPLLSNFASSSFAGTWYVYQRSYTLDSNDLNRNGLCEHIELYVDGTGAYFNKTVFSLIQQAFVSKVDNYYYDDTNYPGIFINYINPLNTNDSSQTYGNPVMNVVQTDYVSYALVWHCQTQYFNTVDKQYLMLLLRSLNNVELTVLPLLSSIFNSINSLASYDGDSFELVYHDSNICNGL